jgi:hypothetical protein
MIFSFSLRGEKVRMRGKAKQLKQYPSPGEEGVGERV